MHAAMQTVEFKPKTKVFEDLGIQVQEIELKILKLTRVKVIDRSYLLEDYREKNKKFKLYPFPYIVKAILSLRLRLSSTSNQ
jgi:hypothetical protein